MKPSSFFLCIIVMSMVGCASTIRGRPELANVKLTRGDSPVVWVQRMWLEEKGGSLVLSGCVAKQPRATDIMETHLDLTIYDASGAVLRSSIERFDPQKIPRVVHGHNHSTYRIVLDPLPAGSARIDIRAHEGRHS